MGNGFLLMLSNFRVLEAQGSGMIVAGFWTTNEVTNSAIASGG
jgi:hypothetical protein